MGPACFVEFRVHDPSRFEMLRVAFEALREDKQLYNAGQGGGLRDEAYYLRFFDARARATFWWPAPTESADPSGHHRWMFGSMIGMIRDCDCELLSCRIDSDGIGRLDFWPFGFPYGGTGCLRVLIEAFGFQVIGEDDGAGYRSLDTDAP